MPISKTEEREQIEFSNAPLEPDGCEFLLVFDDGNFSEGATFLLSDGLAHTPKEVLAKNFGVPGSAFDRIPQKDLRIFRAPVPGPLAADRVAGAGPVPTAGPGAYTHEGWNCAHHGLFFVQGVNDNRLCLRRD